MWRMNLYFCFQNLVNSLGRSLQPSYRALWAQIESEVGEGGLIELMQLFEKYVHTLAYNMPQLFTIPFDAVQANLGKGRH